MSIRLRIVIARRLTSTAQTTISRGIIYIATSFARWCSTVLSSISTLVLLALALWISPRRRRIALQLGIWLVIAAITVTASLRALRAQLVAQVPTVEHDRPVAPAAGRGSSGSTSPPAPVPRSLATRAGSPAASGAAATCWTCVRGTGSRRTSPSAPATWWRCRPWWRPDWGHQHPGPGASGAPRRRHPGHGDTLVDPPCLRGDLRRTARPSGHHGTARRPAPGRMTHASIRLDRDETSRPGRSRFASYANIVTRTLRALADLTGGFWAPQWSPDQTGRNQLEAGEESFDLRPAPWCYRGRRLFRELH